MRVAEAVGRALAGISAQGGQAPQAVFGVVGSGNFHVTNALIAGGARFIAARHECGAAVMADAWARTTGRAGIVSVHQGPGLTNAMTGIAEAAKSRTPLIVLAPEAPNPRSNFYVDVAGLAGAVGAVHLRLTDARAAVDIACHAYQTALGRRTVVLALPLDVQAAETQMSTVCAGPMIHPQQPGDEAVQALAALVAGADLPVFIAGRGARQAGDELARLADQADALLATSAVTKGLFRHNPRSLDVSGGFASPLAAELIGRADLVVGWGCGLNMWTTRHGSLIGADTVVVQVDDDPGAIGAHHSVHLGVTGDAAATALAVSGVLRQSATAVMTPKSNLELITGSVRWRDVPYDDDSDGERIDPRTLSIALDDMLPAERTVAVDSGNFMGYPSMYLDVPDQHGFCFTQAFQSIGLGLATAIGAAVARPDRTTVAALGDGGALMGISELETVVRLGLNDMVIVVYDDEAYGAEVHHFGPDGDPLGTVTFPPADLASIARGFGCDGITVRKPGDLAAVRDWLAGRRERPLLIDAKVTRDR
ncbi:MAG TPA: thiamine pyrophosphate-dependent enzyme, partial [Streptosporangiaceae bacterium]|nr:thiamine pyrophosphate-dependent enzyme [Streptosporangiaceae bacterium]